MHEPNSPELPRFEGAVRPAPLPARLHAIGKEAMALYRQYEHSLQQGEAAEASTKGHKVGHTSPRATALPLLVSRCDFNTCLEMSLPRHRLERRGVPLVGAYASGMARYAAERAEWLQTLAPETRQAVVRRDAREAARPA